MRLLIFVSTLGFILAAGATIVRAEPVESKAAGQKPDARAEQPLAPAKDLSPEEIARRFLIAAMTKDRAGIEQYMLPDDEAHLLWEGKPVSAEAAAEIRSKLSKLHFQRLEPGDKLTTANGKQFVVSPEQVNAERVLLLPEGFRLPYALVKQPDGWKVKATSLIAARREVLERKPTSGGSDPPPQAPSEAAAPAKLSK